MKPTHTKKTQNIILYSSDPTYTCAQKEAHTQKCVYKNVMAQKEAHTHKIPQNLESVVVLFVEVSLMQLKSTLQMLGTGEKNMICSTNFAIELF